MRRNELKSGYLCVVSCGCIVISIVCYGCNNYGSNLSFNISDRINVVRGEVGVFLVGGVKVCFGVWI